ncbi:MAG: cation diffusion facilitator family transporter [Lachnospiraceae bacterium]|nr:cation diffusion facilitator family transporter [Lachnospiraceae bacterium]
MAEISADISDIAVKREKVIVRTSVIGIVTNVLLAAFKAAVGIISNSIAVTLDAVNNLSDALSSVITIVGAKLGARLPDKKHPMGYGRIEYLSSMIVAAIVIYAGLTSFVESVKKIISPEIPDYSAVSLVIIAVAIAVKLILGRFVKNTGEKVNSGALIASGSDASFDAILSASVLASAVIFMVFGISLEAYVGVFISVVIVKAGIEMMLDTLNDILGQRGDGELSKKIKSLLKEEEGVRGAYDLFLHNYGPNKNYASVHLELPDTMTVDEIDRLTRKAQVKVYKETGVILTGVGVYSYNTSDEEVANMRSRIQEVVASHDWALQMHGFYADLENKNIRFDVVITFRTDIKEALGTLAGEVKQLYPDFHFQIVPDVDVSD